MSSKTAKLTVRTERFSSDKRFVLTYVTSEILSAKTSRTDYCWVHVESGEKVSGVYATERTASYWLEGYELALISLAEDHETAA